MPTSAIGKAAPTEGESARILAQPRLFHLAGKIFLNLVVPETDLPEKVSEYLERFRSSSTLMLRLTLP